MDGNESHRKSETFSAVRLRRRAEVFDGESRRTMMPAMSKPYVLWALVGMVGYSLTALFAKLATQSGRFSSFFVLMLSAGTVVTASAIIAYLRGDWRAFTGANFLTRDTLCLAATGVALAVAVIFYFMALSEGPASIVVPIYGLFIVGGAILGVLFLGEPLNLRKILGILLAAVSLYLIAGSQPAANAVPHRPAPDETVSS